MHTPPTVALRRENTAMSKATKYIELLWNQNRAHNEAELAIRTGMSYSMLNKL